MKRLSLALIALFLFFAPVQESHASFWKNLGDSFLKGAGIGVDSNNDGTTNAEDSVNNWVKGVGEDIMTDMFGNTGVGPIPDGQFTLPCPESFNGIAQTTSIRQYVVNILKWALGFLGLLGVIMVIYGGILYLTDGGEGSNVEKAKKIILYSVIGILIVFAAYPIVNSVISIASTGEEPNTGKPIYVTSTKNSTVPLKEACKLQQNANLRPWFAWNWQDSNIKQIQTNVILLPKGTPITLNIKKSDLGSGKYTPEVKFVYWNFGDGNDWTISSPKNKLSTTKTFFKAGKYYASAVIEDKQGARHKLLTQIIVGNVLETKFTASTYFPTSGQSVQFDATSTKQNFGGISEFKWEVSKDSGRGTCPNLPDNAPIVSAKFYGEDLKCKVKLTVRSDTVDKDGNALKGSAYEELIEVKIDPNDNPDGVVPKPKLNYIIAEQDSVQPNLVKVQVEAWDKIQQPLSSFIFEVYEAGSLVMKKPVNFGVAVDNNDVRPNGVAAIPSDQKGTFAETVFDFSQLKGVHEFLFKTTVTNSFGKSATIESELQNITIANDNLAPTGVINVDKTIGDTDTEFSFTAKVKDQDNDKIQYKWIFPSGIATAVKTAPSNGEIEALKHTFTTSGAKKMTLWISDGVVEREILKTVFVNNGIVNQAPVISSIVTSPGTMVPMNTMVSFYPQVIDLNNDALTYKWDFNGEGTVETKNAAFKFKTAGRKDISLMVSDGEKETTKNVNVTVFDPSNPSAVNASQTLIDRIITNPDAGRVNETKFNFSVEFKNDKGVSVPTKKSFKYFWNLGDGSPVQNTASIKDYVFKKPGTFRASLTVDTGDSFKRKSQFLITVVNKDQPIPNRAPVINSAIVSPKPFGKINEKFSVFIKASDPDNDPLKYQWKVNNVLSQKSLPNESFTFDKNGSYEIEAIVSDSKGRSSSVKKIILVSENGQPAPTKTIDNAIPELKRIIKEPGTIDRVNKPFTFTPEFKDDSDLTYEWNFGDGNTSNEKVGKHTFEKAGNYVVKLTAKNAQDRMLETAFLVQIVGPNAILPNREPIIKSVRILPQTFGEPNKPFTLVADGYDPDENDTVEFIWQTDSGKKITGKQVSVSFETEGYHTINLKASDGKLETSITKSVFISKSGTAEPREAVNKPPFIKDIINSPGAFVRIGETTELEAIVKDEEPNSLRYLWNFGDGEQSTDAKPSYTYKKPGNYIIRLTVTDKDGKGSSASQSLAVKVFGKNESMPNRPPVIKSLVVNPKTYGKIGDSFDLKVVATDPDKDSITYNWKTADKSIGDTATINHTFSENGYHIVYATVSDGKDVSERSATIFINDQGKSIEATPNSWQQQYIGVLAEIEKLKQKALKLAQKKTELENEIQNTKDPAKQKELLAELQKVKSELSATQNSIDKNQKELQAISTTQASTKNPWQDKYLELMAHLQQLQAKGKSLQSEKASLENAIANTDDPVEKNRLGQQLLAVEEQIKQNNQAIETITNEAQTAKEKASQAIANLSSQTEDAKKKAEIENEISAIKPLIQEKSAQIKAISAQLEKTKNRSAKLLEMLIASEDPVERSKIKNLLKKSFENEITQRKEQIRLISKKEGLERELSFWQKQLETPTEAVSRVEKQREIQKIQRIVRYLSHQKQLVEKSIELIQTEKTEALETIALETESEKRTAQQNVLEEIAENEKSLLSQLQAFQKSITGMEAEITQKEAYLYLSSIQTKEAIAGKIKKISRDARRLMESIETKKEALLELKIKQKNLEQKLQNNTASTEIVSVVADITSVEKEIEAEENNIRVKEQKVQLFEIAVEDLKNQLQNISFGRQSIGIKNKEEIQKKLEGVSTQTNELQQVLTTLRTKRTNLETKRNLFLKELEKDLPAGQKTALLDKVKNLDLELFELDKQIQSKESSFEVLKRSQFSLKKDLFGSVSQVDLQSILNDLSTKKEQASSYKTQFEKKLKEKQAEQRDLFESLENKENKEAIKILSRQLVNLDIYEKNTEQFRLVFELGTVIQHKSFLEKSIDVKTSQQAIEKNRNQTLEHFKTVLTEPQQQEFVEKYNKLRMEILHLEQRVLEQNDSIDLIDLKSALLSAAMVDEKTIFEEKVADKYKKIAELRKNIESDLEKRSELSTQWRDAQSKYMADKAEQKKQKKTLETIDAEIVLLDRKIEESKAELFSLIVQIDAYYELLDKYFVISGDTSTKFFLYGRIPNNAAKALFIEWHTGDGRTLYGQNAIISYPKPGRYTVRMNVTDGVHTSTDSLIIKVEK